MSHTYPQNPDDWTMADHAEYWWEDQGKVVPPRDSPEWQSMYEQWHAFAFADFGKSDRK